MKIIFLKEIEVKSIWCNLCGRWFNLQALILSKNNNLKCPKCNITLLSDVEVEEK